MIQIFLTFFLMGLAKGEISKTHQPSDAMLRNQTNLAEGNTYGMKNGTIFLDEDCMRNLKSRKECNTILHNVAESCNLRVFKYLTGKNFDIDVQGAFGWTPLHYAVHSGKAEIVKYLLEKTVEIDAQDNKGDTPLHIASNSGKLVIVKYLVEKKADLNVVDNKGKTPLQKGIKSGSLGVLKYLLEKGAHVNASDNEGRSPLHEASDLGYLEIVKLLVETGADVNAMDNRGRTPLYEAVSSGHEEIYHYLVAKGSDILVRDNRGRTLLHVAAITGNDKVANALYKNIGLNVRDNRGRSPAHEAAKFGYYNTYQILSNMSEGFVYGYDNRGWGPVHDAAKSGHCSIVYYAVRSSGTSKFLVDAKDNRGRTPLHVAALEGHYSTVATLLSMSASEEPDIDGWYALHFAVIYGNLVSIKLYTKTVDLNNLGGTLLHYAVYSGQLKTAKYFSYESNENYNYEKILPFHYAAHSGNVEIVKYLVGTGTIVNASDEVGWTPLHYAVCSGNLETVKYLLTLKDTHIDSQTEDGLTPAHLAAEYGTNPILKYFKEKSGANMSVIDKWNRSPLQLVQQREDLSSDSKRVETKRFINDFLIRKFTGRKYFCEPPETKRKFFDHGNSALGIAAEFERLMKRTSASKSIDFDHVYEEVKRKVALDDFESVSDLLNSYIRKAGAESDDLNAFLANLRQENDRDEA